VDFKIRGIFWSLWGGDSYVDKTFGSGRVKGYGSNATNFGLLDRAGTSKTGTSTHNSTKKFTHHIVLDAYGTEAD